MFSCKIQRKRHVKLATTDLKGPSRVKVGFPASKSKQSNINKAVWNEFGTRGDASGGRIPERPFMRNTMRNNRKKYLDALKISARKILLGETSLALVLQKLGILVQGDMQHEITALLDPPNSPYTIRMKGSSKPLINTGEMRQAVTWKVER